MRHRTPASTVALAAAAIWSLASMAAAGQTAPAGPPTLGGCPAEARAFHACALEKAKTFSPPRTPDGNPDIQGFWRGRITMDRSVEGVEESEPMTRSPLSRWPVAPSLIVDPPDGRLPYQPWAAEVGRKGRNFQQYIDPRTMCWGGTLSRSFSDLVQILQPAGEPFVLLLFEDLRVQRVVATDGRPHVGDRIKLQTGDSVGRWEGNTFVVDVTNLSGYVWFDDAGNFHTDTAHLIERVSMIDLDTMHYEITVDDPKAYTRPWKMAWALVRDTQPGFELLEEACWEGERAAPRFREQGYRYYFGDTWRSR
jgi:hypothetical protein